MGAEFKLFACAVAQPVDWMPPAARGDCRIVLVQPQLVGKIRLGSGTEFFVGVQTQLRTEFWSWRKYLSFLQPIS